ncbi:hypothetical protein MN608_11815 [Microdochium nivale]|nr:hypothetical protein MN608_11815 [Microdochium nivale]
MTFSLSLWRRHNRSRRSQSGRDHAPSLWHQPSQNKLWQEFSAYEMRWEEIERFLKDTFAEWNPDTYLHRRKDDLWVFQVPRRLNTTEKEELSRRRDARAYESES